MLITVGHTVELIFHTKNIGDNTVGARTLFIISHYLTLEVHLGGYNIFIRLKYCAFERLST